MRILLMVSSRYFKNLGELTHFAIAYVYGVNNSLMTVYLRLKIRFYSFLLFSNDLYFQ